MQQNVYVVMANRIELEKLAIQGVRQPGHRMPVRGLKAGECPFHGVPGQTCAHVSVISDVKIVVEICEVVMNDRVVEGKRNQS
jgi:hypothetical protein